MFWGLLGMWGGREGVTWESGKILSSSPPGDPALRPCPHSCTGRGCSHRLVAAWAEGGMGLWRLWLGKSVQSNRALSLGRLSPRARGVLSREMSGAAGPQTLLPVSLIEGHCQTRHLTPCHIAQLTWDTGPDYPPHSAPPQPPPLLCPEIPPIQWWPGGGEALPPWLTAVQQ